MNEIYAVDPAAPEGGMELIHLMRLFGPAEGRFLYDFPAQWRTEALAKIEREPEMMKQRAREFLYRRRRAFVQPERYVPMRSTWSEAACLLQPRSCLIGPRGCPPTAVPIDVFFLDESKMPDSRADHVPCTPHGLRTAAQMLFRISPRRIVLVDPYFRLSSLDSRGQQQEDRRFKPVLLELLRAAAIAGTEIMEVYSSECLAEGESVDNIKGRLNRLKIEAGADRLRLESRVLKEENADRTGAPQHARYLLGIGCGLQFDLGFASRADKSLNHIHWLSGSELGPLLARFGLPDD